MHQVGAASQLSTALSVHHCKSQRLRDVSACLRFRRSTGACPSRCTAAAAGTNNDRAAHAPLRSISRHSGATGGISSCRSRVMTSSGSAAAEANGNTAAAVKPIVGFLGMGILGVPMATNLLKAGYKVNVWNRNIAKCEPLRELGAEVAGSAKAVAQACDVTLACLADPEAALEVAAGSDGAAAGLSQGKGYVDVSTIDAGTAQRIAAAVRGAGARYMEAPVSGSKAPAEQGTLIFLTAGDRELFDEAGPLLEVMGKKSFFLGTDVGQGAKMKLVINMVMGSMMASFAEGLALAEGSGLQLEDFIEAVGLGAIAAPMFALKGPSMAKGRYVSAFPLKHQQKDLRLVLELAQELGQHLPVAAASNESYLEAMNKGLGDKDFSAVLAGLREQ